MLDRGTLEKHEIFFSTELIFLHKKSDTDSKNEPVFNEKKLIFLIQLILVGVFVDAYHIIRTYYVEKLFVCSTYLGLS